MSGHTPGPWFFVPGPTDKHGHSRAVVYHGSENICNLYVAGRKRDDTVMGDAALIAAAPELLAACLAAQEALYVCAAGGETGFDKKYNALDTLRAAIAKAEGVTA